MIVSYNSILLEMFSLHCDFAGSSASVSVAAGCVVYSGGFLGAYLPCHEFSRPKNMQQKFVLN